MLQKLLTKLDFNSIVLKKKFDIIYNLACLGFNEKNFFYKKKIFEIFEFKLKEYMNEAVSENDISFLWTIIYYNCIDRDVIMKSMKRMETFVVEKYDFGNWRLNSEISEIYAFSKSPKSILK